MTSNTVVAFPLDRVTSFEPVSLDDVRMAVDNVRLIHVESCLELIYEYVTDYLTGGGFDITDPANAKDMALVYTALKSVMLKSKGAHHPFQDICEIVFEYDNDGNILLDTGNLVEEESTVEN